MKVSICTPTFNRRPFIPTLIKCIQHQTYPMEQIEWVIIDDGTDKIEDLVKFIPQVRYYSYEEKMTLGKKRNLSHELSTGDIIVYMDDDDYYPPERIQHAVESLMQSDKMCAGCSTMYIWYNELHKMFQFGPYGQNHCTGGTMAFKRELLNTSKYDNLACISEEKHFLNQFKVPLIQLDPLKTILVVAHQHNTYHKTKLLEEKDDYRKEVNITIDDFIHDLKIKDFFTTSIDIYLSTYDPGLPKHKPDVLLQMLAIEEKRRKRAQELYLNKQPSAGNMIKMVDNGITTHLTPEKTIKVIKDLQSSNKTLIALLAKKDKEISDLHFKLYRKHPTKSHDNLKLEINQKNE